MTLMRKKKKNFGKLTAKDGKPYESPPSTALDMPCSSSTPSPSPSSFSPPTPSATSSRYDSSLSLLTKKFINLIISTSGDIDLKQAANLLNVQKRRIYDITNVLEGIHLIEKVSKNHVRWIGNQVKEVNPPFPHQKKRQQEQQQKQLLLHQKQERLQKLKSANKELELEHEKLVQLERSMLKSTSHTLGHPQCYLLKNDVNQFLSSHSSHSAVVTKGLPSYPPPFRPHDDSKEQR